jgi:hypothetical protein
VAALLAFLLVSGLAAGSSWETQAYRTPGGELIRRDMSASEVLREAGEPQSKRVVSTGVSIGGKVGQTVEIWTYRGYDGYYDITITGNKVTRIEVTPFR